VSEAAPERRPGAPAGGGGRSVLQRPILGVPGWGWIVIIGAGVGAIVFIRLRRAGSSSTATTQGASSAQAPSDQQIGLTEYEQISAQLTGIEGTDQALLAAIKDLQGPDSDTSTKGDNDARQDAREEARQDTRQEEAAESPAQERRENRRPPARRRTVPPAKPPRRRRRRPQPVTRAA